MNIPALRKLDAMLIVSVPIYLYTCMLYCYAINLMERYCKILGYIGQF